MSDAKENNQQQLATLNKPAEIAANTQLAVERQKHEIQSMFLMAHQFRRDEAEAEKKILQICQDLDFADQAAYDYPRGSERVIGLSIHAVNEFKRIWGRLSDGWEIVEQDLTPQTGFSKVQAHCIDLEAISRTIRVFNVPHRYKVGKGKDGAMKELTDDRDIYEYCANLAQRRKRSCIEEAIPRHIRNAALKQIRETKENADKRPLEIRIKAMIELYEKVKIPAAAIEKYLGVTKGAITAQHLAHLKGIYNALRDGEAKVADYFDVTATAEAPKSRKTKGGKETTETEQATDVKVVEPPKTQPGPTGSQPKEQEKATPPQKATTGGAIGGTEPPTGSTASLAATDVSVDATEEGEPPVLDMQEGDDEPEAEPESDHDDPMNWNFR